ncbi:MAG TPA: cyclic nucleotide-binding domain-containing protein, partial [Bacillota bacterium]
MADADIKALRRIAAFSDLPDTVLQRVAQRVTWRRVEAGEIIFHEGDAVDAIHLLHSGRVKVVTVSPDGREQLLHLLEPGAVFPRVGFFHGHHYPATAWMDEPGVLGILRKASLRELVREDGDAAAALFGMME